MTTQLNFTGTWVLDYGKSHGQHVFREQTIVIEESDEGTHIHAHAKSDNGTPIEVQYVVPPETTEARIIKGPFQRAVFERVDPFTRRVSYFSNGREVVHLDCTLAAGQDLRIQRVSKDDEGNCFVAILHFARQ